MSFWDNTGRTVTYDRGVGKLAKYAFKSGIVKCELLARRHPIAKQTASIEWPISPAALKFSDSMVELGCEQKSLALNAFSICLW